MRKILISVIILTIMASTMILTSEVSGNEGELEVSGIPEDGVLSNPLNATAYYQDPEGDEVSYQWILDGEMVKAGASIRRYIYPGEHNLTVTVEDGNGTILSRTFTLRPIPPPGWDEEADNETNERTFWVIFGIGALILAGVLAWIWSRKNVTNQNNSKKSR